MSPRFPEKRRDSFESRLMYLKKRRKNSAQMASGTQIFFFFFWGGGSLSWEAWPLSIE